MCWNRPYYSTDVFLIVEFVVLVWSARPRMELYTNLHDHAVELFNVTSPPGGGASIVMNMSVCPLHNLKTTRPNFTNLLRMLPMWPWLVLLWRYCDTLCTSGFVDDVTFSHYGPMACRVYLFAATEHDKHSSRYYNRIFLNNKNKKHLKNVGPIRHCEPPHACCSNFYIAIHQVSLLSTPLPRWAEASYSYSAGGVRQ